MRGPYQIVNQHCQASARQDLAGMMADVSPTVQWTEMDGFPCAHTWIGPQQVMDQVFAVLGAEWQGCRFELEDLIDGGSSVVGIGTRTMSRRCSSTSTRSGMTGGTRCPEARCAA